MDHMELQTNLVPISEGVWAIDQGMVRAFLIVGKERALLQDAGAGPCALMDMVRSVTELPVTLVLSHGDGDHTANCGGFGEIFAHPAEFPVITRFRPELSEKLRPVREGRRFDLGGRVLEVIDAPGHTPGSICLLDRENRILFSGDTVSYGPVFLFGDHRDAPSFRETLVKLRELPDYDLVYPCHNTCPVSRDIIPDLIAAVDGAVDGALPGETFTDMPPMGDGPAPRCYRVGKSGILYIR